MWDYPAPSGIVEERMRAAKPPYHVRGSGSEDTEKRNQSTRLFVFRWAAAKQEVAEMMMLCYPARTVQQYKYCAQHKINK